MQFLKINCVFAYFSKELTRRYRVLLQSIRFQSKFSFHPGLNSSIPNVENITFGKNCLIGDYNQLYCQDPQNGSKITIGDNFRSNSFVMINADLGGTISIGSNVIIGPNVVIRASNHKFDSMELPILAQGHDAGTIIIEDDVWLGAGVIVLPNVRIKKGSIVGAGSVVTKDTEEFSISAGIPAQKIKSRF